MSESERYLYNRNRPQNTIFNPSKNNSTTFVAQVAKVDFDPNEKRYTVDVVMLNAKNQKWQNCPVMTHGAGFDRGHVWIPRPEELVICTFMESMFSSPVVLGSLYFDKWRLPYPPRAYMRDDHRGVDATHTHNATNTNYEKRRYGEHWRHMPRGAFWTVNRLGIYRISDRYEADPLLRTDNPQYKYHQDRHFSAGSEFLELDPKKQHTRLYGRRSVVITATKAGLGSGHIKNTDNGKEPELFITFALDDTRPQHRRGRVKPLSWPEVDEGIGFQKGCNATEKEPRKQDYIKLDESPDFPDEARKPQPIPTSTPCQGEECDHDGCLWLRAARDTHINYCRYHREESWVPEIVDGPCDPDVQTKTLSGCMAEGDYPPKSGRHISGRNKDGGYLLDVGRSALRSRTDDRQRHYAKKSYTIQTPGPLLLSGNPTIICNPVLGCGNAAVPRMENHNPANAL